MGGIFSAGGAADGLEAASISSPAKLIFHRLHDDDTPLRREKTFNTWSLNYDSNNQIIFNDNFLFVALSPIWSWKLFRRRQSTFPIFEQCQFPKKKKAKTFVVLRQHKPFRSFLFISRKESSTENTFDCFIAETKFSLPFFFFCYLHCRRLMEGKRGKIKIYSDRIMFHSEDGGATKRKKNNNFLFFLGLLVDIIVVLLWWSYQSNLCSFRWSQVNAENRFVGKAGDCLTC